MITEETLFKSQPRTGHTREPDPTHNALKHTTHTANEQQEQQEHSDLFISETVQILYKSRKVAVHHALHIILYTVPLWHVRIAFDYLASKLHCASRRLPHRPST